MGPIRSSPQKFQKFHELFEEMGSNLNSVDFLNFRSAALFLVPFCSTIKKLKEET